MVEDTLPQYISVGKQSIYVSPMHHNRPEARAGELAMSNPDIRYVPIISRCPSN